jgi:hypothetical protein
MNQKGVDWNKDKAVEYIKVHRMWNLYRVR